MCITILFITTAFISYYSYHYSKLKLLSPTFWAAATFCAFSAVYVITYRVMKNDISIQSMLIILGSIVITAIGSYFGNKIVFSTRILSNNSSIRNTKKFYDNNEIYIARWKTLIVSLIYLYIAIVRFKNLMSLAGGNYSNLIEGLSRSRLYYIASYTDIILSNVYFNQLIYMFEVAVYIHLFIYIYNITYAKKRKLYLLLPLIPDFIARLATTSRSSYLVLFFSVIACYFYMLVKQGRLKNVLITPKAVALLFIFFFSFFWYGRLRNSLAVSILDYVQMYTSASIYNFDYFIRKGWDQNPYFGYYTLQNIYQLIGIGHLDIFPGLPMNVFNVHNLSSNIYTSLFETIQDYGILGMLLLRFFESLVGTKIIRLMLKEDINSYKLYIGLYFMIIVLYSYANFPIGNRFGGYLGKPTVLFRYFIFGWIFVKYFLKPKVISSYK